MNPVLSKYLRRVLPWSRDSAGTLQRCSGRGIWGGLPLDLLEIPCLKLPSPPIAEPTNYFQVTDGGTDGGVSSSWVKALLVPSAAGTCEPKDGDFEQSSPQPSRGPRCLSSTERDAIRRLPEPTPAPTAPTSKEIPILLPGGLLAGDSPVPSACGRRRRQHRVAEVPRRLERSWD